VSAREQGERPAEEPTTLQPARPRSAKPSEYDHRAAPVDADEIAHGLGGGCDETEQAAELLERRLADHALLQRLRDDRFEGDDYDALADALARYGIAVLQAWMHSGYIFAFVAKRGFKLTPSALELEQLRQDPTLRTELAIMTVARALVFFRKYALVGGRWNLEGGANLTTYFIGACMFVFPNEFRKSRRDKQRWRKQDDLDSFTYSANVRASTDPANIAVSAIAADEQLMAMDDRTRAIVRLRMEGYTFLEIRELLDEKSERAIEGVLYRLRKAQEKRRNRR
jgi:hypothetical protein